MSSNTQVFHLVANRKFSLSQSLLQSPSGFSYAITSIVISMISSVTNPTFIYLVRVPSSPNELYAWSLKVCATNQALISATQQTNQVCTQTVSVINSMTISAMSSVITHHVQVLHPTTNSALGLHKVRTHLNLPSHSQMNLCHNFDAKFMMNQFT
jgi:hypothetical protein